MLCNPVRVDKLTDSVTSLGFELIIRVKESIEMWYICHSWLLGITKYSAVWQWGMYND